MRESLMVSNQWNEKRRKKKEWRKGKMWGEKEDKFGRQYCKKGGGYWKRTVVV